MKLTTYNSLLTGKKTMLVGSIGKCGHEGYREVQIVYKHGFFNAIITDGYKFKTGYARFYSLKGAIDWGHETAIGQVGAA